MQAPQANNPIPNGSTTPQTVSFLADGQFGFYCGTHGTPDGAGMAGLIEVVAP